MHAAEEEDWIARNRRYLKNNPNARDVTERDRECGASLRCLCTQSSRSRHAAAAVWLKGKGDDFFRAGDYRGALNAYTAAVETDDMLTSWVPAAPPAAYCPA